jgi:hypothetical protein
LSSLVKYLKRRLDAASNAAAAATTTTTTTTAVAAKGATKGPRPPGFGSGAAFSPGLVPRNPHGPPVGGLLDVRREASEPPKAWTSSKTA